MKKKSEYVNVKPLVAWGIIASLALAILNGCFSFGECWYSVAGLGFFVFGVWAVVILLKK